MKATIHPKWYSEALVSCVCGNTFSVGSTKQTIRVDICSKCHPFFTGEMRFVDTLGRVERFQQKQKKGQAMSAVIQAAKKKKKEKITEDNRPRTLREMLTGAEK